MCGRYFTKRQKQEIAERLHARTVFDAPLAPNYNIAPTTYQPFLRLNRETSERELVQLRWGLMPHSAKRADEYKPFATFNARTETILASLKEFAPGGKAKPSIWREPIKKRRGVVYADGFYEWPESEKGKKGPKHPVAITLKTGEPLLFAGLWDAWKETHEVVAARLEKQGQDGRAHTEAQWLQSFAIVTTEANELMAQVHSRMPVILRERDVPEWLDRDDSRPPPIHLLRPYDPDEMLLTPCNPAVGSVQNNGPEMLVCPSAETLPLNSA
jgi:putative SOS response-associated peptidase YedK